MSDIKIIHNNFGSFVSGLFFIMAEKSTRSNALPGCIVLKFICPEFCCTPLNVLMLTPSCFFSKKSKGLYVFGCEFIC